MDIKFCGAARCVTGSCHLLEFNGKNVLIDCGMRQGSDKNTELGEGDFPFEPSNIDAVLLTHAHIDHSGLIPLLVRRGFTGKVITTRATAELSGIMLPDSGHIQEQEAEYDNRKNIRAGKPLVEPLYTAQDAVDSLKAFKTVSYNDIVEVVPGMRARFNDVGHLLGSAAVEIWVSENKKTLKIVFSGDIGRENRPILQDPQHIDGADYLVLEGTYGDRDHTINDALDKQNELADILREGVARGGNIVIPSFAVGRTQELLYYIKRILNAGTVKGLENIPVYIDSPLGISATKVYERCAEEYYDDEAKEMAKYGSPFDFPSLRVAQTSDESKLINFQPGCNIIISSSGMCDAGRIRHHLKHNLFRKDSTVVFAGYQANGTLGRLLTDGIEKVKLFGEEIKVNATIKQAEGFSGHAGKSELVEWISKLGRKPKCIFLVHGEEESLKNFSQTLGALGYTTVTPRLLDDYSLTAVEETKLPELARSIEETRDVFTPRTIAELAKHWKINGVVAVRKDDMPVYETAFGLSDVENKQLNTLHTRFSMGDITTVYTSALLMLLTREGKISPKDKLDKYVPEYVHASKLTIGGLMSGKQNAPDYYNYFLSGKTESEIREKGLQYGDADVYRWNKRCERLEDDEFLSIINKLDIPKRCEGRHSSYRLLGMVAQRATGQSLRELFSKKLFTPLGLEETDFGTAPDALPYAMAGTKPVRIAIPQNAGGETGIVASAQDMIKFLCALRDGKLLPKSAVVKLLENYAGWYAAFGGFTNAETMICISPKYNIVALVFSNMPENAPEDAYEFCTGMSSFSRRMRSELDKTYIECEELTLAPVTDENCIATLRLQTDRAQEEFVATNALSLAEAYANHRVAKPYLIMARGTPVGFLMFYADKREGEFELWRFMIDARYQGRGFGKAAMKIALDELRRMGASKVGLSVGIDNYTAKHVYEQAGFTYTGQVFEDEEAMTLEL